MCRERAHAFSRLVGLFWLLGDMIVVSVYVFVSVYWLTVWLATVYDKCITPPVVIFWVF